MPRACLRMASAFQHEDLNQTVNGQRVPPTMKEAYMTAQNKEARFNLLIDTCVWLDIAKDYQQQAILAALEELIRQGDIALILPRTVVDEFARNKARVIEDSSRSLSSTLKRAKEAVEKFGDPRKKSTVLS